MNRTISKSIATLLIFGCVFLSSPGFLLADDLISTTSPSDGSSLIDTTSPSDSPVTPIDTSTQSSVSDSSSQNNSTTTTTNNTDVTNQNYVQLFNDSFLQADTGSNIADYNTGSGIITTQKAEGDGQLLNVINENITQTGNNGSQPPDSSNNSSQININNNLTVKNVNDANAINRITANINSGTNDASDNTGHGIITTGNANLGLNFFSIANTNLFGSNKFYANLQNIYNDYTGNVDLSNELSSGSSPLSSVLLNANNQTITNVNNQTSITNQNSGNLSNEIDATVTSGNNKANYNTGTGSVVSGDANSSVNLMNFLNTNITSGNMLLKTVNVFGNWKGDLSLPSMPAPDLTATALSSNSSSASNSNTGSGSSSSANSNVNNSTSITNNNSATINDNVTMKTDSGNNDASYNGGSGIVAVGTAATRTNEMNVANMNITGNSWFLVVINRFGNWNGTAVGSPSAVAINNTGISTVLTPFQSGVNVSNGPTGTDSNNSASGNFNNTTGISNTNQASITNNLNVSAISGENQAKYNSGHGYVETGNINGINNIINFANSNITVGNWVVVVVNVFGDWNGNLIFNTPGGGTNLPVGGSLACPTFNTSSNISSTTTNNASATNNNNANLNNTTDASATTGQNSASYNTGSGSVSTGQAQAGSSVTNQANTNVANTGQSTESATNNNNSTQNNNISGSTNTGQNSSNYNTGNGSVDTSWATTFLSQRNAVNDNQLSLGALTSEFNQTPAVPGSQSLIPSANSTTQVCPGVTIKITPTTASIATGATQAFTVMALDPSGNPVNIQPTFTWTATGGTIDANGVYVAGSTAGSFAVTATASYGNQGSANVTITDPPAQTTSGGSSGGSGNITTVSVGGGGGGGGGYISPAIKGDFNNDGKVDDLDFSILMSNWANPRTGFILEELGGGTVGDMDFSAVMANWTLLVAIN